MGLPARYIVIQDDFTGGGPLIIKDVGPWDQHYTITNDAENVVQKLYASERLQPGQRLLYYDSEGELGELLVKDGRFAGFAMVRSGKL